uniref:U-box domain-containing protein 57 n=1 Tax=Noccaea caerulescens TaxID=107243 RepID=A0A1J3DQF0_NOCCA
MRTKSGLENGKEAEQDTTLHLQEQKHQEELRLTLRKETDYALAIEQVKGKQNENIRFKAEELEGKYKRELRLRKQSESALDKERKELEEMKQQLETCKTEQENLRS